MGFGFNLFGMPILVIGTVILLILAVRYKRALKILLLVWGIVILAFIVVGTLNKYRRPIALTKQDIAGEYRIDTTFYPGKNARWQYSRYKFYITRTDSLYFTILDSRQNPYKIFRYKINFNDGPPFFWTVSADSAYHVIRTGPTLYRGHNKFYYVFHSDRFGNMFFRKVKPKK